VCVDRIPEMSCTNLTPQVAYANGTCYNGSTLVGVWNETVFESTTHLKRTSASEEYYKSAEFTSHQGWPGSRVVSVLDSGAAHAQPRAWL